MTDTPDTPDTPDAPKRTWDVILPSGSVASTHSTREDAEAALQELAKEAAGIPTAGWFLIVEHGGGCVTYLNAEGFWRCSKHDAVGTKDQPCQGCEHERNALTDISSRMKHQLVDREHFVVHITEIPLLTALIDREVARLARAQTPAPKEGS